MPIGPVELQMTAETAHKLSELNRKLRILGDGRTIPRELRKALRSGVTPALRAGRAAARGLPSTGTASTGLRRRTARSMTTQVRLTGRNPMIKVRVSRKAMGDQAALPRAMNRGTWRHPVYGRDTWVTQRSRPSWFDDAMRQSFSDVRRKVTATIEAFERRVL